MPPAPVPADEQERLAALYELRLLDTPPEERFDRLARLAVAILGVPIAYVALIEGSRQWYKASCGLGGMTETGREWSMCSYTILSPETLLCPDTVEEPRFCDNPYVTGPPFIRFYMGHPLETAERQRVGTFCVMDVEPRQLSEAQVASFNELAAIAQSELNLMDVLLMQQDLRARKAELVQAYANLERSYGFIREVFGRYLTEQVAEAVLNSPEKLKLGGEKRNLSVLMSDLRDFTGLSERLPPEQVVDMLNRYLGRMVDVIARHNGTIDEFIGDAILVLFGAPLPLENHAAHAVACALDMQLAMVDFNRENRELGLAQQGMGIGINSGEVVVGNIGSDKRMKYSVVGSPVNLAARIESFTVGGQVLISENTRRAIGSILRVDGNLRVKVKGFDGPVTIFDVGGIGGEFQVYLPE